MMTVFSETQKHEEYIEQHKDEHPFPLDGSDWARLVSIRLERSRHCGCERCEDLISRIHADGGPIAREENVEERAKEYWRTYDAHLEAPKCYTSGPTMEEEALTFAQAHEDLIEACIEAEKEWLRALKENCKVAEVPIMEKIERYRERHTLAETDLFAEDNKGE